MLCRQPETVAAVTRACRELGVELQHCPTAAMALERFALQRFHGVIVDDQDGASAASLLKGVRATASGKKSLIIALAKTDAALDAVFGAGSDLVIYKPLTHDKLRNGLRAIRPLMGKQQHRGSLRVKVDIAANLTVNDAANIPVKILDISTSGAAVSLPSPVPVLADSLKLSFVLPGGETTITTAAALAWKDNWGKLGIAFVNPDRAFTSLMSNWIKTQPSAK
jgi:PilZ domain